MFKKQQQQLAQLRQGRHFCFDPEPLQAALPKPVINFSSKSRGGLITKLQHSRRKMKHGSFQKISLQCYWLESETKIDVKPWSAQKAVTFVHLKNSYVGLKLFSLYANRAEWKTFIKTLHIPTHPQEIPMYISVKSPLCFSRKRVGFVVRIQWKDWEEGVGSGESLLAGLVQKLTGFLFHLFFWLFTSENTPAQSLVFCFLFSFVRIQSHGDREMDPRQQAVEEGSRASASGLRCALTSLWTEGKRANSAAGSPAPPLHRIIIPVRIMML